MKKIGYLLCIVAGLMNGLILYVFGETISHHTGNLTKIGLYFTDNFKIFRISFLLVILYLLGGIFSSYILKETVEENPKKYSFVFFIIAALFAILGVFQLNIQTVSIVTFIMGFQGALDFSFEDSPIRTVHMTGYLSDIGKFIGQMLRKDQLNRSKLIFCVISLLCFILGGMIAFFLYKNPFFVFLLASIFYILAGGIICGIKNDEFLNKE